MSSIFLATSTTSTLPPPNIIPTLIIPSSTLYRSANSFPIATAIPTPALGSMQTLRRSHITLVALKMSSSDTVMMSSTKSRTMGHVFGPKVVFSPSATLFNSFPSLWPRSSSDSKLRFASSSSSGSAKIIFTLSPRSPLNATVFPAANPPPPTGIITASKSPISCDQMSCSARSLSISLTCSTISKQTVPCPAITHVFSVGWIRCAPPSSCPGTRPG
mmetsp:Transcript_12863/g.37771  ORF Transcript_12863/g.37771 Transcript_12863/m.37771 type:complete len:217 (+) Transcript_12863:132-782(+)